MREDKTEGKQINELQRKEGRKDAKEKREGEA